MRVISKYGIGGMDEGFSTPELPHENITKLDSFMPRHLSFTDEAKRVHKCSVSMIDFRTKLPAGNDLTIKYHCYWDRHSFDGAPMGIPISYIPKKVTKTYTSEISKDTYSIKGCITDKQYVAPDLTVPSSDYYESDGVVCSWNCMLAYIEANKTNSMYTRSKQLMFKLYKDINGVVMNVKPAPDWRQLTVYGGSLSITEFRNNFDKIDYLYQGVINPFTTMKSLGHLWEEKFRF